MVCKQSNYLITDNLEIEKNDISPNPLPYMNRADRRYIHW